MPKYATFLIAPFQTGLYTVREPWMSPRDAFPVLLDARVDNGYVQKRGGVTELVDTGAGYPIMGMYPYMRNGHPSYLVVDQKRLYRLRTYAEELVDVSGADTFTGGNKDFFWFQTWRDKCYFCNGVDGVYEYDETADTVQEIDTVSDASTDIQIESARMIFRYKGRLIFICPMVGGTVYPRRAYYTEVSTLQVKSTNYVNGDIEDVPVAGCYIQGIPTIFGHEGFVARISYTYNTDTPFAWEEMERCAGVLGPLNPVVFGKQAILVGHNQLMTWDGYQSRPVGPQIRDFVSDIDHFNAWYMQATLRRDKDLMYLAYPNDGSSECDRILEYNFNENTFAIHRVDAHCLLSTTGHIAAEISLIQDEFGSPSGTELGYRSTDILRHPTYGAMTLIGGHTGKVYLFDEDTDDDGTAIEPEIWTTNLNPYANEGRKAYFGGLRILASNDAAEECTVSLYKDFASTAYKTVTLTADGAGSKQWVELHPDGEVGNVHRLSFTGGLPKIHAIEIDMAPGGRLDAGGADGIVTVDATTTGSTIWRFYQDDDTHLLLQKYVSGTWTTVQEYNV